MYFSGAIDLLTSSRNKSIPREPAGSSSSNVQFSQTGQFAPPEEVLENRPNTEAQSSVIESNHLSSIVEAVNDLKTFVRKLDAKVNFLVDRVVLEEKKAAEGTKVPFPSPAKTTEELELVLQNPKLVGQVQLHWLAIF